MLVREDLNVPLKDGQVADATRIKAAVPTLKDLQSRGAMVIVMSHLGRPKGVDQSLSLRPVALELGRALWTEVKFAYDCVGPQAQAAVSRLQPGSVLMLENVRFHPEDEANDPGFAQQLASLGEIFCNDAFASSHRVHASVVGVAQYLPAYAGRLMEAELNALHAALDYPKKPLIAVIGGAKVSTKIGLLNNLAQTVDSLIIGGAMANTFLKAQGHNTGNSLIDDTAIEAANQIWKTMGQRLVLPVDLVATQQTMSGQPLRVFPASNVEETVGHHRGAGVQRRHKSCRRGHRHLWRIHSRRRWRHGCRCRRIGSGRSVLFRFDRRRSNPRIPRGQGAAGRRRSEGGVVAGSVAQRKGASCCQLEDEPG